MEDKLLKYCKYLLIALMVISLAILGFAMLKGESGGTDLQLGLTYGLAGIMVAAMIFSPIYGVVVDPKSIKGILVAFGAFAVVALLAYLLSPGATLPQEMLDNVGIDQKIESICDFQVMFLYVMVALTILSIIYSAVAKLFN